MHIGFLEQVFITITVMMISMTAIWLYLVNRYYVLLREKYPQVYQELHLPRLSALPTIQKELDFFRHVFGNSVAQTDVDELNEQRKWLRYFFYVYSVTDIVLFAYVFCLIFDVNFMG